MNELRRFGLLTLLASFLTCFVHAQDPCASIDLQGLYLNPFADTTLYVQIEVAEGGMINYPGMRVFCDAMSDEPIGEVNPNTQMFGWLGLVTVEISLIDHWNTWFEMDAENPDIRIEYWENFYSELVCETPDIDVNEGPNTLFHNYVDASTNCPDMLSGNMYGTATFGQAATVHIQLHETQDGELIEPPLIDEQDAWSDVAITLDFCLDPSACYSLVITPIEVGPDPYWLSVNGSLNWGENWMWLEFQGLDPVVIPFNPYGGVGCTTTDIGDQSSLEFLVYPNPASDWFTLQNTAPNAEVRVVDATGNLVMETRGTTSGMRIETSNWAPGLYLVEVRLNGHSRRQPLLIGG